MTGTLLVTGTDTDVGKTLVSRAILRALVRDGHPTTPLKLIETGLTRGPDGELISLDGRRLADAARWKGGIDVVAPLRFALPASPLRAAGDEARSLTMNDLRPLIDRARATSPRLLIEGAGGLLVPINRDTSFADLASAIDATILVVARDALGTINHTLLTIEAARRRGLRVAAVVLNTTRPAGALRHLEQLRELTSVPILGPLPWVDQGDDDQLADAFRQRVASVAACLAWFE